MIQQFPCSVCHKSIGDKGNWIFCDLCKLWTQIKASQIKHLFFYIHDFTNFGIC